MNKETQHEDYDDDDYESLIPSKYRDLDKTSFEKIRKRDDWE